MRLQVETVVLRQYFTFRHYFKSMLKKILLAGTGLTVAIIITISLVSCCFSIDFDAFKTTPGAENREDSAAQNTETETAETTADESTLLEKPQPYLISKLKERKK